MDPAWKEMEGKLASNPRVKIVSIESADKDNADSGIPYINNAYLKGANAKLVHTGYPTLFVIDIRKKKITYYSGPRSANDFVNMANSAVDLASKSGGGGRKRRTRHKRQSVRRTRRRSKA
jgi:hypothetical protein